MSYDDEPFGIHIQQKPVKPSPIHYSGPLCIVNKGMVTRQGGGHGRGSCACTGRSFSDQMSNTWDRTKVTCKSCLKQIERHDFSAHMYPNEKVWDQ